MASNIEQCIALATDPSVLEYLASRVEEMPFSKEEKAGFEHDIQHAMIQMNLYAPDTSQCWSGVNIQGRAISLPRIEQEKALQSIADRITPAFKENVLMEYNLNDPGKLDVVFSKQDNPEEGLPVEVDNDFRNLVDVWLKQNQLIRNSRSIYLANEEGKTKINPKNGEAIMASPMQLKSLIQDEGKGLQAFMQSQQIQLSLREDKGLQEDATPMP